MGNSAPLLQTAKPYSLGILVGRFQVLHTGHEQMISIACALCDKVGIFVGSSQESGTAKNPFSFQVRKQLLQNIFGDRVEIYPLPDIGVGNTSAWGDYVLQNVKERFGMLPDLLISGKEARRLDWFDGIEGNQIAELYIPKTIDISASQVRQLLIDDNFDTWKQFVNEKNHGMYPFLRALVLESKDNLNTQSI